MDLYLAFVRCFATWLRIRVFMGFIIAWAIIVMSLSAWMMQSDGGSFSNLRFGSARVQKYKNWRSDVCEAAPYAYLSPFQFTYSSPTNGTGSTPSYCAWPLPNSALRLTVSVTSIVVLGILYVKTPLSLIARMTLTFYSLLYFACFVIDAAVETAGVNFCQSEFENTYLSSDMQSLKLSIACTSAHYSVLVVFDVIASILLIVLQAAWGLAKDLYVDKTGPKSKEERSLLKSRGK